MFYSFADAAGYDMMKKTDGKETVQRMDMEKLYVLMALPDQIRTAGRTLFQRQYSLQADA